MAPTRRLQAHIGPGRTYICLVYMAPTHRTNGTYQCKTHVQMQARRTYTSYKCKSCCCIARWLVACSFASCTCSFASSTTCRSHLPLATCTFKRPSLGSYALDTRPPAMHKCHQDKPTYRTHNALSSTPHLHM